MEKINMKRKRGNEGATTTTTTHNSRESNIKPQAFKILDALSATGLRAIRYAKEIPFVTAIVASDLSVPAIRSMKENIDRNGVEKIVRPNNGDARRTLYGLLMPF
jgi:tRNA (guanine26-N2/guanine27-N2)-dimethyltransferase